MSRLARAEPPLLLAGVVLVAGHLAIRAVLGPEPYWPDNGLGMNVASAPPAAAASLTARRVVTIASAIASGG